MIRLEYQALRKFTGEYYGTSHSTIAGIAAIEPLERKLYHNSVAWFARYVRNYKPDIRSFLEDAPTPALYR